MPNEQDESGKPIHFEVEVQIIGSQFGHYLSKKPQVGESIYFLDAEDSGQGTGTIVSFRFPIKERLKLGFFLSLNTSITRDCQGYNDFWQKRHLVDLENPDGDYFFREDILCINPVNDPYSNKEYNYTVGGLGVSLAKTIGNGKIQFEPSVNLGLAWLTATEPYLFLKEKNSNNTRTIHYLPAKESFAMPSIGIEAKAKWQASKLFGFSSSLQYNYMRSTFDYTVEEKELLGSTVNDDVKFRQSLEYFAFSLGVYLSF
ncbi:MAG: hypothetical protein R3E32_19275 [Chitinophagales bacterium]